jgi:hypothetical protein
VVAVLRHVSGDPTISAHTLRHGFATFQSYQSHLNGMPPYMADLLTGWIGHCEAQSLDRNPGSLSRRSLWEVTDQIGHGSINTTFASYVHLADVELGGALACIPVRLKLSTLENLTGMPAKSLHKAAERANRNPIEEALRRTRKATELANPDLPYKLRDPDTQVAIQLPAAHDQPNESEFNPTDVCWTILLCRANMLPSRVARRLRIPIAHVDRWNAGQNWLLSLLTVRGAKRHGELFRVRHAYSSSENAMLSSLQAGLAARDRQLLEGLWLHARYKTRGLSYVDLAQPDDARKYIAWLIRLGIPAQDIEIQPGRERRTALFTLATTYPGIVIATDDEIAHASTGVPSAGVVRLFVRLSLHTGSAQPGVRAQQYSTEHYWLLHMALVYVFCDLQSLGWA